MLAIAFFLVSGTAGVWIASTEANGVYTFLDTRSDGSPFRWNPCRPIHYVVNLTNAPDGAVETVREATDRVTAATGITFVFDGVTDLTPRTQKVDQYVDPDPDGGWLPVLVAWANDEQFSGYADPSEAVAVAFPARGSGNAYWVYESGLVVVDADQGEPVGFDDRSSLGPILMHELGHIVGLGHVGDGGELMWSPQVSGHDVFPDLSLNDWGPGDRKGLHLLGRDAGCIP